MLELAALMAPATKIDGAQIYLDALVSISLSEPVFRGNVSFL